MCYVYVLRNSDYTTSAVTVLLALIAFRLRMSADIVYDPKRGVQPADIFTPTAKCD